MTGQEMGDSRALNFFTFGDGWFIQRQTELRGSGRKALLFMRAKRRSV